LKQFEAWMQDNKFEKIALLVVILLLSAIGLAAFTPEPIVADAEQNVTMAYYLRTEGVVASGIGKDGDPKESSRREVFPILVNAAYMWLNPVFWEDFTLDELINGSLITAIKTSNIIWGAIFFYTAYVISTSLTQKKVPSLLVATFLWIVSLYGNIYWDNARSEVAAATTMLIGAIFIYKFMRMPNYRNAIYFGLSLSIISLTRAVFLYVGVAFFAFVLLVWILEKRINKNSIQILLLAFLMFAIPNLAWMTRNYIHLDSFELRARGGDVIYLRVLETQYTGFALLYAWSPPVFQDLIGAYVGYSPEDLDEGGRLGLQNRENPSNYKNGRFELYDQMIAEASIEFTKTFQFGDWLTQLAFEEFQSNPAEFLIKTPAVAWRGIWTMSEKNLRYLGVDIDCPIVCISAQDYPFIGGTLFPIINLSIFLTFIWIIPYSFFNRYYALTAIFILPFGMFIFHTVFSHNIPRYNYPLEPFMWLSAMVFIWTRAGKRPLQIT